MAFTLVEWARFLHQLHSWGYEFRQFGDYEPRDAPGVWIRHDVDYSLDRALHMMALEGMNSYVRSAYFYREWAVKKYLGKLISPWAGDQFQVGYHYEFLYRTEPELSVAVRTEARCKQFGLDIVSAHGKPFIQDPRRVWPDGRQPHNVYYVPETCGSYLSDTGRFAPARNTYDRCFNIGLFVEEHGVDEWPEILEVIEKKRPNFVMNAHPDRWTDNPVVYAKDWALDQVKGVIKQCLSIARSS